MAKKLYEVKLTRGKNNKNWHKFYNNIDGLNGKGPDYGGINNVAIVSHHVGADTVHLLCTEGFRIDEEDVTVEEITKKTLEMNHNIYVEW